MLRVRVIHQDTVTNIETEHGANLRRVLLDHDLSPYVTLTRIANCGGRGLCATCGVWIETNEPAPDHWHDKLASQFGYPRLSCQITVETNMIVRLLDNKLIWGNRDPERARRFTQADHQ